jgi:hypothetical protein
MANEKFQMIPYEGNQITLFSDGLNDYISLTEMAKAWKNRKSIPTWLKNKQTLEFLVAWEKRHNKNFSDLQMKVVSDFITKTNYLTIDFWVEKTNAIGIFTRSTGTFAHKDIAIRFAAWLSPEFEIYLVEEIQRLKEVEKKVNSFELLNEEQILALIRLKEVFKYVAHQTAIEEAHKQVFAAHSAAKNPFAEFNMWRNKILDIEPATIDERIRQYCVDNKIALTTKILRKTKQEKILMLDSYEAVRNAVWDFLQIQGEVNAMNLARLVEKMIRIEKGEVLRINETDLFHEKQDLGEFNDFGGTIAQLPQVRTARQVLAYRNEQKQLTPFDVTLKTALDYNPKDE